MAVFKVPRIERSKRLTLLLEPSEVVFDVNENIFYGGNGVDLGGFPLGKGAGAIVYRYTLTTEDINNKYIVLPSAPYSPSSVRLNVVGGIEQRNGTGSNDEDIDFIVTGDVLSWSGLGLDNFLEPGETLIIQY